MVIVEICKNIIFNYNPQKTYEKILKINTIVSKNFSSCLILNHYQNSEIHGQSFHLQVLGNTLYVITFLISIYYYQTMQSKKISSFVLKLVIWFRMLCILNQTNV